MTAATLERPTQFTESDDILASMLGDAALGDEIARLELDANFEAKKKTKTISTIVIPPVIATMTVAFAC